jgi:hypothetical protein
MCKLLERKYQGLRGIQIGIRTNKMQVGRPSFERLDHQRPKSWPDERHMPLDNRLMIRPLWTASAQLDALQLRDAYGCAIVPADRAPDDASPSIIEEVK